MSAPTEDAVREALGRVIDPELRRPITDLGMVESVEISPAGVVTVAVLLTVAGCPLKDTITADTRKEVGGLEGVSDVQVHLGVMTDEQRAELRARLRGGGCKTGGIIAQGRRKSVFQTALSFEISLEEFCSDIAECKQAQNGEYDSHCKQKPCFLPRCKCGQLRILA